LKYNSIIGVSIDMIWVQWNFDELKSTDNDTKVYEHILIKT